MAWYKTGSISAANGAAVVYGAGTAWVDAGVLNAGDIITINGTLYEILSIQSNTQLTLASNYLGATAAGLGYAIMPIGLLPSALAQQVKTTLATANTALSAAVRSDVQNLTAAQQQTARNNIGALGAADVGAGRLVKSVAGGVDVVLTAAEAANQFLEFTGTLTANISVIVPAAVRLYYVVNNTSGAFSLTVKTAGGSGASVASGGLAELYCDGTNVRSASATNLTLKGLIVDDSLCMGAPSSNGARINLSAGVDAQHIRIADGNHNGSLQTYNYPVASYYARRDGYVRGEDNPPLAVRGATASIVFTDRPGTEAYQENCRSSDIQLWTARNNGGTGLDANPQAQMTVRAEGRVLIGTTTDNGADRLQVAGSLCATGPSRFGQYTLSTLPSASAYNGYIIAVSNAAGGPALCLSNGSSWINIRTNAPVN